MNIEVSKVTSEMSDHINPPVLIECKRLLKPVYAAKVKIKQIDEELVSGSMSAISMQGLFALSMATFETMILDILRYYLRWFPQKLKKSAFNIDKEELLGGSEAVIGSTIERELNRVSYGDITSVINHFCTVLSIDPHTLSEDHNHRLVEAKASRNLLLHNNLVTNRIYLETAGPRRRSDDAGVTLEVDETYMKSFLGLLDEVAGKIECAVTVKYGHYTRVAAIERLWKYLFQSPVMVFEDYWQVDVVNDKVVSYKGSEYEDGGRLSSSEFMFLGIWQSHFHGHTKNLNSFSMYSLDSVHKRKMLYFLSILDEFRLE